ncbi:hypothetical protein FHS13_003301 [Nocardiopsis algeriensis]|uniref:Uncharacterized protein n=1 Tax=Nocardiopsis algeriensis TaxID=1478215 RepID=A0A841IRM6_9ACTN|nr:hypothetical protein [Nocardiopsis algeriensis]
MFHDSGPPAHHRPVVPLGAGEHLGILVRGQLREPSVGTARFPHPPAHLREQVDDLRLTAPGDHPCRTRVGLRVLRVGLEALAGTQRGLHVPGLVLA